MKSRTLAAGMTASSPIEKKTAAPKGKKIAIDSTPTRTEEAGLVNAQNYMVATGMMKAEDKPGSRKNVYTNKFVPN